MQEMSRRTRQVANAVREELVQMIHRDLNDPRIQQVGMITVSGVKLSPDHKNATVYVSFMGKEEKSPEVIAALVALQSATGFFHRSLLKRLQVKAVPRLIFRYDSLFDNASSIQIALSEAAEKEAALAAEKKALEGNSDSDSDE